MQIYHKANLRTGGASHPSRTFGKSTSYDIAVAARRRPLKIYGISSTFLPGIYRQNLVRRAVFSLVRLLVRPWPYRLAPAAGDSYGPTYAPSHARYAIPCIPLPSWSSSKCRNTPSTNQLHVVSFKVGRSVLLNKDYCLNTSFSSKFFRQSGNAWNLLDFDNHSAAITCVETKKYYSIPSFPSRLEGVKTRPQCVCVSFVVLLIARAVRGRFAQI